MAQMSLEQGLVSAFNLQHAGRLGDAEKVYRQIIAQHPDCTDALHLLGIVRAHRGDNAEGLGLIRRAIEAQPEVSAYHVNLGNILLAMGQAENAVAAYTKGLQLKPGQVDTYLNLGIALQMLDRLDEAAAVFREAQSISPTSAKAHHYLGEVLHKQGNREEAIAEYRAALEAQPGFARSHNSLGNALFELRRLDEAIASYRAAITAKPDFAEAWSNLGNAQREMGQHSEAIASAQQALAIRPDFAEALGVLGNALRESGRIDEAIEQYQKSLALRPDIAEIHLNLALALAKRARLAEAMGEIDIAIELRPKWPVAWSNRAKTLRDQGWLEQSITAARRALELDANLAEAHINLGGALLDSGDSQGAADAAQRAIAIATSSAAALNLAANAHKDLGAVSKAISELRQAVELEPNNTIFHSNLVFLLNFDPATDAAALLAEQRRWDERHAAKLEHSAIPIECDRNAGRRLRVGYVSPDFREHCQSFFTIPLFANHDRVAFELFAYADLRREDSVTEEIRQHFDHWKSIRGMSDAEAAEMIRRDQIDILVDLTMHMADGHLPVFGRKPAPVQVTWLAYPGSTGLSAMDYRLTDPYLDPPGMDDPNYSEISIRLAETFWCYHPLGTSPEPGDLPAARNGFVTFGCLNNFCKVNESVLRLWARVMNEVRNSRFMLLCPQGGHRDGLMRLFEREGVEQNRIELVTNRPRPRYLELYQRIDIGLDTCPYNGHTTSLDSLWMGVPVVSMKGDRVVGRAGVSQLSNLGLKELAATTVEEFISAATNLANDLPRLAELRRTLRTRMGASPLMDGRRFARSVEAAYRQMWSRFCNSYQKGKSE